MTPNYREIDSLLADNKNGYSLQEQRANLDKLVNYYNHAVADDEKLAQRIRQHFLYILEQNPHLLAEEKFSSFLADHIRPEDFAQFQWEAPESIASFCETLYSVQFPNKLVGENINTYINQLLRYALQQFEQRGKPEKMFQLLRLTPVSSPLQGGELHRLRGLAYRHEMRRVKRNRRFLYGYLVLQLFLVVLVFPLLFINAENGRIQREIEQAVDEVADVSLSDPVEGRQFLTYSDGLYWAFITAGSIGYGDITPHTRVGKIIAGTLGQWA